MNFKYYYSRCLIVFLLATGAAFPASGQQMHRKTNDLATQLINKLQIDLTGAQSGIKQLLKRNFFNLPDQKSQKLKQAFDEGYSNKNISTIFKDSLRKKMTPELRKEVSDWLNRSSTKAIVRANKQYNTLQGKRKRVIAMYKLDQNPLKPARRQVLSELWNTTADFSQATSVAAIMFRSIIEAYDKLNDDGSYSDAKVEQIVQSYKNQVLRPSEKAAKKSGIHSLAVKYYNVKTSDLKAYLSFFKSNAGQSLINAIANSTQAAYKVSSRQFLNLVETSVTQ